MNSGNICYFNSLIQILYYIRPFRKQIIEGQKKSELMKNFQEFFCELANKEIPGPIDPTELLRCFAHYDEMNPQQQDIHEFMMILFDEIEKENDIVKEFW